MTYQRIDSDGGAPIKAWTRGVAVDWAAMEQLKKVARLPIVYKWVAAMPDVHVGIGATVGSVIPTRGAIIPAAVGVDIGCGMSAARTTLSAKDLPESLRKIRTAIEAAVPHGKGAHRVAPASAMERWGELHERWKPIAEKHPKVARGESAALQIGTLGGGNHFVEVCLDGDDQVWFMLHSGSRGIGNRVGSYFIELAKKDMQRHAKDLPDKDLAYFEEGAAHFDDYVEAVTWAQDYARANRRTMMEAVVRAVSESGVVPAFTTDLAVVDCHHNYVAREPHYGEDVFVTRKGAVRAREGDMGIIPGSMGARSFIVRGKGHPESFASCSHGAGRLMSRTEAKRRFSVKDHAEATKGVECRKDADVVDETPGAYKPIDQVMSAQADLVEIAYELRQVVCVKG
jgi:tRNA-splicing ligase RtcB